MGTFRPDTGCSAFRLAGQQGLFQVSWNRSSKRNRRGATGAVRRRGRPTSGRGQTDAERPVYAATTSRSSGRPTRRRYVGGAVQYPSNKQPYYLILLGDGRTAETDTTPEIPQRGTPLESGLESRRGSVPEARGSHETSGSPRIARLPEVRAKFVVGNATPALAYPYVNSGKS